MNFPSFDFQLQRTKVEKPTKKKQYYTIDIKPITKLEKIKYKPINIQPLGEPIPTIIKRRNRRYYQYKLPYATFIKGSYEPLSDVQPLKLDIRPVLNPHTQFLSQQAQLDPKWHILNAFHPNNKPFRLLILQSAIKTPSLDLYKALLFALQQQQLDPLDIQITFTESFVLYDYQLLPHYLIFLMSQYDLFSYTACLDCLKLHPNSLTLSIFIECLQWMGYKERAFVLTMSLCHDTPEQALLQDEFATNWPDAPLPIATFDHDDPEQIVLWEDIQPIYYKIKDPKPILIRYLGNYGMDIFYFQPSINYNIPHFFHTYKFDYENTMFQMTEPSWQYSYLGSIRHFLQYFEQQWQVPLIPFLHSGMNRLQLLQQFNIKNEIYYHDLSMYAPNDMKLLLSQTFHPTPWQSYLFALFKQEQYAKIVQLCQAYLQQHHDDIIQWICRAINCFVYQQQDGLVPSQWTYEQHYWIALYAFGLVLMDKLDPIECQEIYQKMLCEYPISDVWLLSMQLEKRFQVHSFTTPFDTHFVVVLIHSWLRQKAPPYMPNPFIIHCRQLFGVEEDPYAVMNDVPFDATLHLTNTKGFRH